ncbi:MAG: phage terminase large subunit [Methanomicrobiaceae archaeon]|nr:phage terminase large subunit [Methanomicrobiaceae archaeon]
MQSFGDGEIEKALLTLAKNKLSFFTEYTTRGIWEPAKHLDYLCNVLEAVERGEIRKVIITMPPGHGKSEVATKSFPAWYLGRHPQHDVLITSYGANLAEDFSEIARDKLKEFGKSIFGEELPQATSAVKKWGLKGYRGRVRAAGAGGAITGRRANVAIIDDPFKGPEDAFSEAQRQKVLAWFRTVLRTRLTAKGAIILIQTRWHKEDLAGYLLNKMENGSDEWTVINLPAIAEENDLIGREPGEPLWPEMFGIDELLAIKEDLLPFEWNSLYQQRPGDPEGNLFKRQYFRYFEKEDEWFILHTPEGEKRWSDSRCTVFQTCDPAGSTKETADYFVLATWAATPHNELLLLDVIRDRIEEPDQPDLFDQAFHRWHPAAQGVEPNGVGLALWQNLKRTSLPVEELKPEGDKYVRAIPMARRYKSGMVYHQKGAPWLGVYEDELLEFPYGKHDDQVDNASYANVMLQDIELYQKSDYREGDFT